MITHWMNLAAVAKRKEVHRSITSGEILPNYDRLEAENRNLRRRVSDLEHCVMDLQRKYYEMMTYVKGKEIEEYLKNYEPKKKKEE